MLELEGVRSGYGKLEILQSASLRVPDGTIIGIIGPNGAGKSTLLKTAFGYLMPSAGRIALDGRDIAGRRPDEIVRLGVGYLSQAGTDKSALRRAIIYGSVMGSFAVEEFGTKRIQSVTREEIDGRARSILDMLSVG